MKNRSVVEVILLGLFTCGIYSIYWQIVTWDSLNDELGTNEMSGGVCFLLNLLTCGIYGIYWNYKMCKKVDEYTGKDEYIVPFILSIFFGMVVSGAILQDRINSRLGN